MDLSKTGKLICNLRKEKGLTQKQVAEHLGISAKAVSKWECGHGFPDVVLIRELSELLGVNPERLFEGSINKNRNEVGNMKNLKFYVCEGCGSIITASGKAEISCCGKKLAPLTPQKSNGKHAFCVEEIEDEYYVKTEHAMTKEHYISFVAYVCMDRVVLVRLYPEQDGAARMPRMRGGKLYFYCNTHGLFVNE